MKKLPLTIIILTDRNDVNFESSLVSAQFADEVLIVDNNSNNNWQKLSQNNDFRIIEYGNGQKINNFSEVRNLAMKSANSDWVLFLDSDELLDKNAPAQIEDVINSDLYDGVYVWRSDKFHGKKLKYGEAGRQRILRFFKKDVTIFNRAIHEVAKVSGKIGQSEIEIEHLAHNNISDFLSQVFKYSFEIGQNYSASKQRIILEMICFPPSKFILNYLIKFGFLDGWRGLIYAIVMSLHSFIVRVSAFEKNYAQTSRP